MDYQFDWGSLVRAWPYILDGMGTTAFLVIVGMILGILLGMILAIVRLYGPRPLAFMAELYVNLFRAIPLILTIFWFFFLMPFVLRAVTGNPYAGVGAIYAALAAFVMAEAAYYCEIIRAGILSVRAAQMQAATALGLSRGQALRYVILPQAIHNMMPSLVNQTIALLKDTSLVYVISLNDFLGAATKVAERDGTVVEMYLFVAAVYLVLCSLGVWLVNVLKAKRTV